MEIIKSTLANSEEIINDILTQQKEAVVYCIPDDYCVIIGNREQTNQRAINNLNLNCIKANHEGGIIIMSPGDVEVGIFTKGYYGHDIRTEILEAIIQKLIANGIEAQIIDNDVLIDGRKVIGFGSRMVGKILYTAIQISVNINLELIRAVCTKPMFKVPDGLSNYGVTTEYVISVIEKILSGLKNT